MRLPWTCALLVSSACASPQFRHPDDAGAPDPGVMDAGHASDGGKKPAGDGDGDVGGDGDATTDGGCMGAHCSSDPCALNHGGCDEFASCTTQNGKAVCGTCSNGFVDDGQAGCLPVLLDLKPSIGALSPAFDARVPSYTLEVGLDTTNIALTAEAVDAVTIKVANQSVASNQPSSGVPVSILKPRDIAVELSAKNGHGSSYAVNVTRAPRIHTRLAPDTLYQYDDYGGIVAIDGDTVVVGVDGDSSNGAGIDAPANHDGDQSSGAVYVYRQISGKFEREAFIKVAHPTGFDRFGLSLALEGDLLAVGAPGEDSCAKDVGGDETNEACSGAGAVFLFRRGGDGKWSPEAYLKASNTGAGDAFGTSVNISGDTLVVGARGERSSIGGVDTADAQANDDIAEAGAVYVFRNHLGVWNQESYLKPHAVTGDYGFGNSVDLDGDTLAVSAPGDDGMGVPMAMTALPHSGAVYVFERSGATWQESAQLRADNAAQDDELGNSLVLRGDLLVAGAWSEDSSPEGLGVDDNVDGAGAVYVFKRKAGVFAPLGMTKPKGIQTGAYFGVSVTLCDEHTMFVGSQGRDQDAKGDGVTAYLLSTEPPFEELALVESRNPTLTTNFGGSADCQPDTLFVGAYSEDGTGAAYVIR